MQRFPREGGALSCAPSADAVAGEAEMAARNPLPTQSQGAPMVTAQAFVFDAYGTLFDVHAVVTALQAITPEAEALSHLWRTKQLEYTWLRSLMGRYVDFWRVTEEALRFALTYYGLQLAPAQHATLLNAYL